MERLTRRDLADVNRKQIVLCNYKEEDCNDFCLYRRCKWNEKALQKLKAYEDAEEQGLLLRLPCSIGTVVYEPYCHELIGIDEHRIKLEDLKEIGKTVFLTKEEAEQALARMEGENG